MLKAAKPYLLTFLLALPLILVGCGGSDGPIQPEKVERSPPGPVNEPPSTDEQ